MHRLLQSILLASLFGGAWTGCATSHELLAPSQVEEECDDDVDGALLGTLIGAGAGYIAGGMILGFDCPDGSCYALAFGFAGAVGGFWGGLAHDSQSCKLPE